MVSFERVCKFILADIDFHIPPGAAVGVIGPSGAGKTTLLKLSCGLLECDSGRVSVFYRDPVRYRRELAPGLRAYFSHIPLFRGEARVDRELDAMGILYGQAPARCERQLLSRQADQLSLGQRRRAELAAIFAGSAKLFILDEPTNGLDGPGRELFRQMVREKKEEGAAVLIASHNMAEIEELCDRILLLNEGRLLYYGEREQLMRQYAPVNRIEIRFQGALPDLEELPVGRYSICGNLLTVTYNANHISAAEIVQRILEQTQIVRIGMTRPRLEDAIAALHGTDFREHKAMFHGLPSANYAFECREGQ